MRRIGKEGENRHIKQLQCVDIRGCHQFGLFRADPLPAGGVDSLPLDVALIRHSLAHSGMRERK